jgi:hypothetical protein
MSVPTVQDIRDYLESFGISITSTYSLTGDLATGSAIVHNINTVNLKPSMLVNSTHITPGTRILTVDIISATVGQITLDSTATGNGTAEPITITYYPVMSDDWIIKCRDNYVVPWLEKTLNTSFSGTAQIEEYYSGNGTSILVLNRKPIISLDALSYTNVMSNQYVINILAIQVISEEGLLKVRTNFNESTWIPIFAKGLMNLRVKYTYGYAVMPVDIFETVKYLVCEQILGLIEGRTGGGDLSVESFSRSYGGRGKYTNIRSMMSRNAYAIIRNYITSNVGVG